VITTTTTLIGTLPILGNLDVIVALKLTSLVLNMFCTSIFLGHSPYLCSTLNKLHRDNEHVFFKNLTSWVLIPTIGSTDLNITIRTIGTSLFLL
jgi:hypothetical protein